MAISRNDSVVFIDAFHSFYREDYLPTPINKMQEVLDKRKPYEKVIGILVTHFHRDHADIQMIQQVLAAHPEAKLFCSSQLWNQMDTTDGPKMEKVEKLSNVYHK